MILKIEILSDIKNIRKKTSLLSNPLYNDVNDFVFWNDIDSNLKDIEQKLKKEKFH